MQNDYQILLDEVRQNFASVVWTHKIQEKQADIYASEYKWLETINILLAAATSCGIITTIFVDGIIAKVFAACFSFGTLAITAYFKSFDLISMEKRHRDAANQLIVIRNRLLHVISELHMKRDLNELNTEYKKIMQDLDKLYIEAPSTTDEAVKKASEALKSKAEYSYTDEEIDHFLPSALRGGIQ